ncbi:hypothetical protein GCM10027360_54810 [Amycolatopsis echigonensis]
MFTRGNTRLAAHRPAGYEFTTTLVEGWVTPHSLRCPERPHWDQVHTAAAISAAVGGSAPLRETVIDAAFAA